MKKVMIFLFLTAFTSSCEKRETVDLTYLCKFPENLISSCYYGISNYQNTEIVIKDAEAYHDFENAIRAQLLNTDCDTATLPYIDFSLWTLLGEKTQGGGCSAEYDRRIGENNKEKKVTYTITVVYSGQCYMLLGSWNWVLVPKLKEGYTVESRVE